jgi:hypothetical protein
MRTVNLDTRFVWYKPETAFTWGKTKGDYQLKWPRERTGGHVVRYHPPLSLFRTFADLKSDPKSAAYHILSFANEHGDILGTPGGEYYQRDEAAIRGRRTVRPYASSRLWRNQIRQMQWAVALWDQCNDDRLGKAARQRTRQELQIEIESALRDLKTPRCARALLSQKLELFVYPVNLLAFMWLTLARLLSGQIVEQCCMGVSAKCVGHFYTGVDPGLKKTGTITCSPACRKWKERHDG